MPTVMADRGQLWKVWRYCQLYHFLMVLMPGSVRKTAVFLGCGLKFRQYRHCIDG
jgi:hypothetical protein